MKFIAHRGFSSKYPENTIEAFKKAYEYKIDGIETDVQLSKDGIPVICHDERTNRTTGVTGFIKNMTLSELKELNACYKFEGHYEIPTLEELLVLCKENTGIINLELKTSVFEYPGIEQKVYDLIMKYDLLDRIIISSFNHECLQRMKQIDKRVKCGVLTGEQIIDREEYCSKHGFEYLHPSYPLVNKEHVELAHKFNVLVNVWTIDDPTFYERMKQDGVDAVIGNCPDLYCEKK